MQGLNGPCICKDYVTAIPVAIQDPVPFLDKSIKPISLG